MPGEKMRSFGKFLKVYLSALLLAVVAMLSTSCNGNDPWSVKDHCTSVDSVSVAQHFESIINPQFETVQELIAFQQRTNKGLEIDSIFRTMSPKLLFDVGTVVLHKERYVTKKSVVYEYRANSSVYDNLPSSDTTNIKPIKKVDLQSTDLGSRSNENNIISTSYSYKDTVINGKTVKILIKTEEKYVR